MDNALFRNMKIRRSEQSLRLVEELVEEEILPRLPVKSLLRLRCVSKSWRSLIGSKRFIKTHLKNSINSQNHAYWRAIFNCTKHGLSHCSLLSYMDGNSKNHSPIYDPTEDHLMVTGMVVGCCNGLACIVSFNVFMSNPATRISFELPRIDVQNLDISKCGFGWEEESGAYKVFVGVIYEDDHERLGKVYSSKTNSWKTVKHGSHEWRCSSGKFACGRIHWITECGHIESFDLKSEVFGAIELPCKPEDGVRLFLWVIEGCLSVVCDDIDNRKRSVWVMKEYGVKESWVEEISQPAKKITRCCEAFFYPESLASPLPENSL